MDGFIKAMRDAGISTQEKIHADGNIHRIYVDGDKAGSRNGWYVVHNDHSFGAFGCWKRNIKKTWFSGDDFYSSCEAKNRYDLIQKNTKKQRENNKAKIVARCQHEASYIWNLSGEATNDHPYLRMKKVNSYGLRLYKKQLVVPIRNVKNDLCGLQYIDHKPNADGSFLKKSLPGSDINGNYYLFGCNPNDFIYLAEGYATAVTIHEATGQAVAVSFGAGNLKSVAQSIMKKYPTARLVICADNDRDADKNTGLMAATEAAQLVGALLAVPMFPTAVEGTDFNDLAAAGLDVVRQQILSARAPSQVLPGTSPITIDWVEPYLFDVCKTPPVPSSALPSWLGKYAAALSRSLQTPEGMAVMMLLSCAATCLQKKYVVEVSDGYAEPLNLWTVTAIEPGSRKTAVVSAVTEPLILWEQEQAKLIAPKMEKIKTEREINSNRKAKLIAEASKMQDHVEREKIIQAISDLEKDNPKELICPVLWTGDVTPERLQNLLVEHDEKMSLLSDEAVIFYIMTGLYSEKGVVNLDIFLQAYSGSAGRADRTTRMAHLSAPALTFGLLVQPAVISDLGGTGLKRLRGRGVLDRFLYCLPENTVGRRDVRNMTAVPEDLKKQYCEGIYRLLSIRPVYDLSGMEQPRRLKLDSTAHERWVKFSEKIELLLRDNNSTIKGWLSKLPGTVLRIAGNFYLIEHEISTAIIDDKTIKRACDLVSILIDHAKATFNRLLAVSSGLRKFELAGNQIRHGNQIVRIPVASRLGLSRLDEAVDSFQKAVGQA